MAKTSLLKRRVVPVPQTREEAFDYVSQIVNKVTLLKSMVLRLTEHIRSYREATKTEAEPIKKELDLLVDGLMEYANANYEVLTDAGKHKTVAAPAGHFGWRKNTPSVELSVSEEAAITQLEAAGRAELVRVKKELNREAILTDPSAIEGIDGISINLGENYFFVRPKTESPDDEEVKRKLKRPIF